MLWASSNWLRAWWKTNLLLAWAGISIFCLWMSVLLVLSPWVLDWNYTPLAFLGFQISDSRFWDFSASKISWVNLSHLEPDILECEVKWPLESITTNKASGGDGISVELFQILKEDAVKVLHSICQQIWKTSSGHRTGKGQFSFQSQRKANPKNAQTTTQLHSSHMLVK